MLKELADFFPSELHRAIDRHLQDAFTEMMRYSPIGDWYGGSGYRRLVTGLPNPFGNLLWDMRLAPDEADARIAEALAPIKEAGAPALWLGGAAAEPADIGRRLEAQGMIPLPGMPGMAVALASLVEPPLPPDTTVERIRTPAQVRQWVETMAVGYELPLEVAECFAGYPAEEKATPDASTQMYLALQKGRPVACSMLFLNNGIAGIYCVATAPEARRQGMGAAVTAIPLLHARQRGYRTGILHASEMGFPVYKRLGFQEQCHIGMYLWMPPTEDVPPREDTQA